jgi:hypothetical protein
VFVSPHDFATMKGSSILQLVLLSALAFADGAKLQIKDGAFHYNGQKVFLSGETGFSFFLFTYLYYSIFHYRICT